MLSRAKSLSTYADLYISTLYMYFVEISQFKFSIADAPLSVINFILFLKPFILFLKPFICLERRGGGLDGREGFAAEAGQVGAHQSLVFPHVVQHALFKYNALVNYFSLNTYSKKVSIIILKAIPLPKITSGSKIFCIMPMCPLTPIFSKVRILYSKY